MYLGMDHIMKVFSYCVLRKSHCVGAVMFVFIGLFFCLVGFFGVVWFCGVFFPFRLFSWDLRQKRRR